MDGRDYRVLIVSDLSHRDGMHLELYEAEDQRLEIFYSDADGAMTFTACRPDLPLAVVEWAIVEGRARLTPTR
ncbi:MAG: hypothetical protein EON86_00235 [Brevundimonas sp.]|nr:MAG: hypothetical protein EON86_00235 [Brevundimonas sp.]